MERKLDKVLKMIFLKVFVFKTFYDDAFKIYSSKPALLTETYLFMKSFALNYLEKISIFDNKLTGT